jgi:hypothetical protein
VAATVNVCGHAKYFLDKGTIVNALSVVYTIGFFNLFTRLLQIKHGFLLFLKINRQKNHAAVRVIIVTVMVMRIR